MNPSPVALPQAPAREDSELVAAVRRGEETAFSVIHGRYATHLEAYCARLLGSSHEAEDAVQQTFLKAHQSLKSNGNGIVLGPWLYTIARNESITILRARRRRPEAELDLELGGPATPGAGEVAESREALRETLEDLWRLPAQQREALVQTSLEMVPGEKVAASLGCEPAKVKSLVFRARAHLSDLRAAREMGCQDVKRQIAEDGGAALRRRVIREHLRRCESCGELAGRPRFRRKLARAAPIVLWPFLAGRPFEGFAVGAGTAAASAGGGTATIALSGIGAKVVTAAVTVVAAAGGVAANRDSAAKRDRVAAAAAIERQAADSPAALGTVVASAAIGAGGAAGSLTSTPAPSPGAPGVNGLASGGRDPSVGLAHNAERSASGPPASAPPPQAPPAKAVGPEAPGTTAPSVDPAPAPANKAKPPKPSRTRNLAEIPAQTTPPRRSAVAPSPSAAEPSGSKQSRKVSGRTPPGQSKKASSAPTTSGTTTTTTTTTAPDSATEKSVKSKEKGKL